MTDILATTVERLENIWRWCIPFIHQFLNIKLAILVYTISISGWWLGHPSEKYLLVNWDDEIPNRWENAKNGNPTTNQIFRLNSL